MVPLPNLLAFIVAAVVLIAVPGPSVLFVVGRSIAYGRRVGLLSVLGNTMGLIPQIAAVALGIGAVVAASATMFMIIKSAGAVYLIYLGVQAIRHRHRIHAGAGSGGGSCHDSGTTCCCTRGSFPGPPSTAPSSSSARASSGL